MASTIVMYVVVRRDLLKTLKWPVGSVISQACHATSAAIWLNKDDPHVIQYVSPEAIKDMHKVVLEVEDLAQLEAISAKLSEGGVIHHMWTEQPENIPTCLATKPSPRESLQPFFKGLRLFK